MRKKIIVMVLAFSAAYFIFSIYFFKDYACGQEPKWDKEEIVLAINNEGTFSISPYQNYMLDAMGEWNNYLSKGSGSIFCYFYRQANPYFHEDSINAVGMDYIEDPEPLAVTMFHNHNTSIEEVDVVFNKWHDFVSPFYFEDLNREPYDLKYVDSYSFKGVALHELGHVLGLDVYVHEDREISVMNKHAGYEYNGKTYYSISQTRIYGKELCKLGELYGFDPTPTEMPDVAILNWQYSDTSKNAVPIPQSTFMPDHGCYGVGDEPKITFGVANLTNDNIFFNYRVFLSEDDKYDSGIDISITDVAPACFLNGGETALDESNCKIPLNIPTGFYYIIGVADPKDTLWESDERNNVSVWYGLIIVYNPKSSQRNHPLGNNETIQDALNTVLPGTTILVPEGTYNENLTWPEKPAIKLKATGSPEKTIIDAGGGTGIDIQGEVKYGVIEGFTIQNTGFAGIYLYGDPVKDFKIDNCIIKDGVSGDFGYGICCKAASPVITNCIITNTLRGIYCQFSDAKPTIENCTIKANTIHGIVCDREASPAIKNCSIIDNTANGTETGQDGAGIYICDGSSPSIVNCFIAGNSAKRYGGGIYFEESAPLDITHCTFSRNSALTNGGAIYCKDSSPQLTNCILWDDSPQEISKAGNSGLKVTYSTVEGGYSGEGNSNSDPRFFYPDSGKFHLLPGSPCIDSGVDAEIYSDVDGDTRPLEQGFDMGADEFNPANFGDPAIVPDKYSTIQAAVNSGKNVVLIKPGTYTEPAIRIAQGPVFIRGYGKGPDDVIIKPKSNTQNSLFEISQAYGISISNLTIEGNSNYSGSGIDCDATDDTEFITVQNCIIHHCGAAITAHWGGMGGGELSIAVMNNTLANNGYGVLIDGSQYTLIENNIIVNNTECGIAHTGNLILSYNDVWGNGSNYGTGISPGLADISLDPQFRIDKSGKYLLSGASPCINAGNPLSPFNNEPMPNGKRINMGAYGNTSKAECSTIKPQTLRMTNE